ncbi:MAG: class I SAM-dependent methyltransferase, partial [Deltaproteobacteria bacterium]|nr:class I SAM-dependent methyltransferase [Deltaproteobacteria bacterium]
SYTAGGDAAHWCGHDLHMTLGSPAAGQDLLDLDGMRFLERFLEGEVDLEGNLYLLSEIREHARLSLKPWHIAARLLRNAAFQGVRRSSVNVRSHYDIAQEALDVYLDQRYLSYSCAIWEHPHDLRQPDLVTVGTGEHDEFDSLEKAQWRKFRDAADYIAPKEGETLLDVGCGYGGQLAVALDSHPFGVVVGWTHSRNQVARGRLMLADHDRERWELNQGDYRSDDRLYDHITSTGMVSHVGPRGLVPYVRNVRKRIRTGGRYLHHSLMTPWQPLPLDFSVGVAFNKKYVWPGFHWFTLAQHVRALERNGFHVVRVRSLTHHYAKTTAAWYERMTARRNAMVANLGEPTFRAWQVYLAGITGTFLMKRTHVYRLYCEAV